MQLPIGGRKNAKWLAVGLVALIEVGAVFYYVLPLLTTPQTPRYAPTISTTSNTTRRSTTTTSSTPAPSIEIQSALIVNDSLKMIIKNKGTVPTQSLSITGICTPGFVSCYSYSGLGGRNANNIFVLSPGGTFYENITGVCVVPETGCTSYHAVANFSYYLVLKFTSPAGKFSFVGVVAKGNNTYPTNTAVEGVVYTFDVFSKNGSGVLNAYIATNASEDRARFSSYLYMQNGKGVYNFKLLTNTTSCDINGLVDCSSGNFTMTMRFYTVSSGIATPYYPPPYMLVVRDAAKRTPVYFAMWVQYKQWP